MFIDIHTHSVRKPGLLRPKTNDSFATPEQLIQIHDAVGIHLGVLLPCVNPEGGWNRQTTEDILEIVEMYPDRFVPFCNIDPRFMNNSAETDFSYIIKHYQAQGCLGIGEICANLYFDDPRVANLFYHAEKCEMPVLFHVATREGDIYGLIDELHLPRFEKQLQQFPELVFFCHSQAWWSEISGDITEETHGGYPKGPVKEGGRVVELMRKYPTVIGDLSAGSGHNAVSRDPEFGYSFMTEFQNQLVFGTDICAPFDPAEGVRIADFLKDALAGEHISQEVFDKIAHKNLERLLKL